MGKSIMEQVALLPSDEQAAALEGLDMEALVWDWSMWARTEQRPPQDDSWAIWLYLAGRGSGKTRSAAEWVREKAKDTTRGTLRFALVARTAADVRDVIVEGESGIINVSPPSERPHYEPSKRRLTWANGNTATLFCASEDTEVLTRERGWVTYKDLSVGDLILTFNETKNCSEWQPAESIHSFDAVDTPVAHIVNRFHDSLTTLEHRWPTYDRNQHVKWVTTRDIVERRAGTKTRLISAAPNADLPKSPIYPNALVEVVAWYMTEGTYPRDYETSSFKLTDPEGWNAYLDAHRPLTRSAYRTGRRIRGAKTLRSFTSAAKLSYDDALQFFSPVMSRPAAGIAQSQRVNPKNCENIERALTELFGPPREIGEPTGLTWTVDRDRNYYRIDPDAAICILEHFSDRRHKVLSREFILSLTKEQLELFVDRCVDGDGHRKSVSNISMGQNNADRDDCFAFALTLLGRPYSQFATKKEYKGEPYPYYSTSVRRSSSIPLVPRVVDAINVIPYNGVVWCPVTKNGTWFARRNGKTYFTGNTADEPDGLRGIQAHYAWADELAAWRQTPDAAGMTSWDNLRVATRLGSNPQIIATTTPKRVPVLYGLLAEAERTGKVYITRGSTLDNAGNLSSAYLDTITGVYAGTRLAQQELYGEMLDDVEGALWNLEMIEAGRQMQLPMNAPLRVIGVDPSVAENPRDECGIVVCTAMADRDLYKRHAWVLEDATVHGSPEVWANTVASMARKWQAPVVAEINQGGALVRNAIQAIDPSIKVLEVHSKYGKALRAEPVVLAYEQARVHHVGILADLEAQMCAWIPGEGKSPDRIDALVHALTALLIKPPPGFVGGRLTAKSFAHRRLPQVKPGSGGGKIFTVR